MSKNSIESMKEMEKEEEKVEEGDHSPCIIETFMRSETE